LAQLQYKGFPKYDGKQLVWPSARYNVSAYAHQKLKCMKLQEHMPQQSICYRTGFMRRSRIKPVRSYPSDDSPEEMSLPMFSF